MKKLILATVASTLYAGACYLAAKHSRKNTEEILEKANTPVNAETVKYENIDGHFITFEEADHIGGEVWNAMATGRNEVVVTRTIRDSKYYKAVLDHEIGHIVAAERMTIFHTTADLFRIEWQADKYSVEQGNLEELFEFRLMMLKKYWYAPVTYNTTNLVMLTGLKIKKALSK